MTTAPEIYPRQLTLQHFYTTIERVWPVLTVWQQTAIITVYGSVIAEDDIQEVMLLVCKYAEENKGVGRYE